MSDIDQQFIEYVVKSLVGKPEAVHIDRRIDEKGVLLELTVDPEDLGRVIGKRGATAQSLRTLLRALGTKNDARYNLKIIDNGPPGAGSGAPASDNDAAAAAPDPAAAPGTAAATDAAEPDQTVADELPAPVAEPEVAAPETPPAVSPETALPPVSEEDQASDRLRRTRAELADLDDLDV